MNKTLKIMIASLVVVLASAIGMTTQADAAAPDSQDIRVLCC